MSEEDRKKVTGARRRKLIERIRNLVSKTAERGCTEAEALAAAEKASKLLDEYDIDRSEIDDAEEDEAYRQARRRTDDPVSQRLWRPASAIERITGTRSWVDGEARRTLTFFGRDGDVMVAEYMLDICGNAMRHAFETFRREKSGFYRGSWRIRHETAFLNGMSERLYERLMEIHEARKATSTGRDLIVSKDADLSRAMTVHGLETQSTRMRVRSADDDSYDRGSEMADRVAFNAGIGSSSPTRRRIAG